jgi:hypothetical protein
MKESRKKVMTKAAGLREEEKLVRVPASFQMTRRKGKLPSYPLCGNSQ